MSNTVQYTGFDLAQRGLGVTLSTQSEQLITFNNSYLKPIYLHYYLNLFYVYQAGGVPVILHSPHPPGGWPQGTQEKKIKHVNISFRMRIFVYRPIFFY